MGRHPENDAGAGRVYAVRVQLRPGYSPPDDAPIWEDNPVVLRRGDGLREVLGCSRNLDGLARYLLQFGAGVEVLGPPPLRRRLARTVRELAALYEVAKEDGNP